MKLHRNSKLFINYFLGPLVFIWLSWSIYNQVKQQPSLGSAWQSIRQSLSGPLSINLVIVVVLMLINWSLESVKWRISVRPIQEVSFGRAFKAVLSGISFAVSTPNRIGEYFGRMLYMNEGNRLRTISITIVGSMSQLIVTCVFGIAALIAVRYRLFEAGLINPLWFNVVLSGAVLFTSGLILFYFRLSWLTGWIGKITPVKKYMYLLSAVDHLEMGLLLRLLVLSVLRYFIFILQYALVLPLFAVQLEWWQIGWGVGLSFLIMAAIPTVALIELPLRGKTMATVLGLFSSNALGIGLATAAIWLINLIIPAIAGSLLMLGMRKLVKT